MMVLLKVWIVRNHLRGLYIASVMVSFERRFNSSVVKRVLHDWCIAIFWDGCTDVFEFPTSATPSVELFTCH
jgi:hypothetical protein